jgi:putative membrane protein
MTTDLPQAGENPRPENNEPPATPATTGPDQARGDPAPATTTEQETEPDARFTFANERTFLAWHRTALALVVAGLAIVQLLPPFPGIPFGRHILALPLIALGGALSVASYREWIRHQRALRRGEPMGASHLPRVLAVAITVLAVAAAVLSLLAPTAGS